MAPRPSADAERILVERALADFDAGIEETRRRLRAQRGRAVAASLDALLSTILRALRVRARLAADVREALALGARVAAGEDPQPLARQGVERIVAWKAAYLARKDDAAYKRMMDLVVENVARRLPDLGRLALVPQARDLPDLLRQAFPRREEAEAIVRENEAWMTDLLGMLEAHPHVMRAPRGVILHAVATGREVLLWQMARVRQDLDAAYGPPG